MVGTMDGKSREELGRWGGGSGETEVLMRMLGEESQNPPAPSPLTPRAAIILSLFWSCFLSPQDGMLQLAGEELVSCH